MFTHILYVYAQEERQRQVSIKLETLRSQVRGVTAILPSCACIYLNIKIKRLGDLNIISTQFHVVSVSKTNTKPIKAIKIK